MILMMMMKLMMMMMMTLCYKRPYNYAIAKQAADLYSPDSPFTTATISR